VQLFLPLFTVPLDVPADRRAVAAPVAARCE
jgi:hypothetical protein